MGEEEAFGARLGGLIATLWAVGDQHWAEYFQRTADQLPGDSVRAATGYAAKTACEQSMQIVGRAERV